MKANEYQELAKRTCGQSDNMQRILNSALGLCGESGEFADRVKKHVFQGHELGPHHLMKELGDILWYVANAATGIEVSIEDVMEYNVAKLLKRYPDGFDADKSINRDLENE